MATPPPLRVTEFPVPFIPLIVGRDRPIKETVSPRPSGELEVITACPNCLPYTSLCELLNVTLPDNNLCSASTTKTAPPSSAPTL